MRAGRVRVFFNSPVILWFVIISLAALILGAVTNGASTAAVFSVYRTSWKDPLTYARFIGHIFGHADGNHFMGNMTMLLLVGPIVEEKYGSVHLMLEILTTALVTGIVHVICFPHIRLLGASGVVFACILSSSMTRIKDGKIPATFLLVAGIYIGGQIYEGLFVSDYISNLTHILGGIIGSCFGYRMTKGGRMCAERY